MSGANLNKQSPLLVGDRIWSSVRLSKSDTGVTIVQRCEWDNKALSQFRRFRVLVKERKRATNSPQSPLEGSFEDLPGEVRNLIYELVMVQEPAYIELSPKTNRQRIGNTKARYHHMKRLKREVGPALRLMRVNKTIGAEAASVYYGSNEFRFTSVKGWYVLDTFLREIGPENVARLRSIAVHVPWRGRVQDCPRDALPESNARLDQIQTVIASMGLHPRKFRSSFNQGICIGRTARILESIGMLRSLRLILPDSFSIAYGEKFSMPINIKKFPHGFSISLVSLQGGFKVSADYLYWGDGKDSAFASLKLQRENGVINFAKENGLEIMCMAHDKKGYYPSSDPDDHILEDWNDPEFSS